MDYSFSSHHSHQAFQYGQDQDNDWSRGNSESSRGGQEDYASERVNNNREVSEPDNSWLDSWESAGNSRGGRGERGSRSDGENTGDQGRNSVPGNNNIPPSTREETTPPVSADNNPVSETPTETTPSNGSGTFQLGNTSIQMSGGTAEMQTRLEENFTGMYNSDAGFRNVIDSKSGTGITVGIEDLGGNTAGLAALGGNDMKMDTEMMGSDNTSLMAEVIAHEVGHLAGLGHGAELDNFAVTAGSSYA